MIPSEKDTIIAPITAITGGAVSVIRISGRKSLSITNEFFKSVNIESSDTAQIYHGFFQYDQKEVDEVLISVFKQPHSFTGENVIEVSCHANPFIVNSIIDLYLSKGCRIAEPGEFTRRAFLNNRIDLAQAEAVQEIITAQSQFGITNALKKIKGALSREIEKLKEQLIKTCSYLEMDLDFSEEGLDIIGQNDIAKEVETAILQIESLIKSYKEGRNFSRIKEIVITGRPNVGKSSLMNALVDRDRVIVSETPGTTRDYVHEEMIINDIAVKLVDTAGVRSTSDKIEKEGVEKTQKLYDAADIILAVFDISTEPAQEDVDLKNMLVSTHRAKTLIVGNKMDLPINKKMKTLTTMQSISRQNVSAKNKINIDLLKDKIYEKVRYRDSKNEHEIYISSERQYDKLSKANKALKHAMESTALNLSYEFIAVDLRDAITCLSEIIGEVTTDDILNGIFANFCIGK